MGGMKGAQESAEALSSGLLWTRLLAALPPTRRAIFREGKVVSWQGEEVRVEFDRPFFYERAMGFREEVERAAETLLRRRVRVVPLIAPSEKKPSASSFPSSVAKDQAPSFPHSSFPHAKGGRRGRKVGEKDWLKVAGILDEEGKRTFKRVVRALKPLGGEVVLLRLPKAYYLEEEGEEEAPPAGE